MDTIKKIAAAAGNFLQKRWRRPSPVVLHRAAEEGDVQTILASLKDGVDPEERIEDGVKPLHRAAERGHAEAAAVLLAGGATPDISVLSQSHFCDNVLYQQSLTIVRRRTVWCQHATEPPCAQGVVI